MHLFPVQTVARRTALSRGRWVETKDGLTQRICRDLSSLDESGGALRASEAVVMSSRNVISKRVVIPTDLILTYT